ncbi:MAG: dTDP-4-dehydrorhamnose reductase [Bacteroidales bacterium]|jgi:dTDP-4-dehydrorhamnose reductase|nr:dTDP-4-dehydrorhamnose reductase [Bacteroidales bacterium]
MINILVTGANGQLGSELKEVNKTFNQIGDKQANFIFTDTDTLNLSNNVFLKKFFQDNKIDYVINCAAYTDVDQAEKDADKAYEINAQCVNHLIQAIEPYHAKFIHLSTDYVFDGKSFMPYTEEMIVNPESIYGKSKLEGEKIALAYPETIIIRTSWLYSSFGKNFAKTIHRLCNEREELNVVYDQIGTPTYARDLAHVIFQIIEQSVVHNHFKPGIYHYSNEGVCSWYDFAKAIAQKSYAKCKINPIESKDYPTLAKRPFYSVLNKTKIKSVYTITIPHWQDSLVDFFREI